MSVSTYLNSTEDPEQRRDAKLICKWLQE